MNSYKPVCLLAMAGALTAQGTIPLLHQVNQVVVIADSIPGVDFGHGVYLDPATSRVEPRSRLALTRVPTEGQPVEATSRTGPTTDAPRRLMTGTGFKSTKIVAQTRSQHRSAMRSWLKAGLRAEFLFVEAGVDFGKLETESRRRSEETASFYYHMSSVGALETIDRPVLRDSVKSRLRTLAASWATMTNEEKSQQAGDFIKDHGNYFVYGLDFGYRIEIRLEMANISQKSVSAVESSLSAYLSTPWASGGVDSEVTKKLRETFESESLKVHYDADVGDLRERGNGNRQKPIIITDPDNIRAFFTDIAALPGIKPSEAPFDLLARPRFVHLKRTHLAIEDSVEDLAGGDTDYEQFLREFAGSLSKQGVPDDTAQLERIDSAIRNLNAELSALPRVIRVEDVSEGSRIRVPEGRSVEDFTVVFGFNATIGSSGDTPSDNAITHIELTAVPVPAEGCFRISAVNWFRKGLNWAPEKCGLSTKALLLELRRPGRR